jgi:hypothetical protein
VKNYSSFGPAIEIEEVPAKHCEVKKLDHALVSSMASAPPQTFSSAMISRNPVQKLSDCNAFGTRWHILSMRQRQRGYRNLGTMKKCKAKRR